MWDDSDEPIARVTRRLGRRAVRSRHDARDEHARDRGRLARARDAARVARGGSMLDDADDLQRQDGCGGDGARGDDADATGARGERRARETRARSIGGRRRVVRGERGQRAEEG